MLRVLYRRPYQLIRCSSEVAQNVEKVNEKAVEIDISEIEKAMSIRELREMKNRLQNPGQNPSLEDHV